VTALLELVVWFFVAGLLIDGFRRVVKHALAGMGDDRMWVRFISVLIVVPTFIGTMLAGVMAIRWVLGIG